MLALGALGACGSGRSGEPAPGAASSALPAARPDGGGAPDASMDAAPVALPSEPEVVRALATAIQRNDGRALAELVDPDYGLALYSTQGTGSGYVALDAIAVGETTAPARRPRRAPLGAPAAWVATGWRGVAALLAAGLTDVSIEPPDPSSPAFGFCRGQHGLPGDGAPSRAYLRRGRDDADMHVFDSKDRPPPVPLLTGLTLFGNARIVVALRRTAAGWRVVHIVLDDRCRASPDP